MPLENRPAESRWIWPGTLSPQEEAAARVDAGQLSPAFVCAACIQTAFRREVTSRWRDAAIAVLAALILLALKWQSMAIVAALAALICIALAVWASAVLERPARNGSFAAEIVRRSVRRKRVA